MFDGQQKADNVRDEQFLQPIAFLATIHRQTVSGDQQRAERIEDLLHALDPLPTVQQYSASYGQQWVDQTKDVLLQFFIYLVADHRSSPHVCLPAAGRLDRGRGIYAPTFPRSNTEIRPFSLPFA